MIPGLRQILLNNAELSGLLDGERIFTGRRWLDSISPSMLLSIISTTPAKHKSSVSALDQVRVQVSIYSESPAESDQIGRLVRSQIDRYAGTVTVAGITYVFDQVSFEDESDDYDDTQKIYFKRQDYMVLIRRS